MKGKCGDLMRSWKADESAFVRICYLKLYQGASSLQNFHQAYNTSSCSTKSLHLFGCFLQKTSDRSRVSAVSNECVLVQVLRGSSVSVTENLAGPQTYNISRGMAAESMYKAYLASTLHGAFGSSAERKGPTVTREAREQPGPAHYQPPIAATCSTAAPRGRIIRATSNFASHSERIKKTDHLVRA